MGFSPTVPGGTDKQIQFDDGGKFNGDANLTWDKSSQRLVVTGVVAIDDGSHQVIVGNTSGNTRGQYSVDLQSSHASASNVVSGAFSVGIGLNCTVSADSSACIGSNSTVAGDGNSTGIGYQHNIASGEGNTAVGKYAYVDGTHSTSVGYNAQIITADDATAVGSMVHNSTAASAELGYDTKKINVSANGLVLVKLSANPSTAIAGAIYFNTSDNHFYGYNGTTWKQLDN